MEKYLSLNIEEAVAEVEACKADLGLAQKHSDRKWVTADELAGLLSVSRITIFKQAHHSASARASGLTRKPLPIG